MLNPMSKGMKICIFIVTALVCVLGTPALVGAIKENRDSVKKGSEIVEDYEDALGKEIRNKVKFSCSEDLELFVGEELNLLAYIVTLSPESFDFLLESSTEYAIINGLKISSSKEGVVDFVIKCKKKDGEKYVNLVKSEINVYQKFDADKFKITPSFTDINQCGLLIEFNKGIDLNCFRYQLDKIKLVGETIAEDNINLQLELSDFSGELSFNYSKSSLSGENDLFSFKEELSQDVSFFKFLNETKAELNPKNVELFLTKDSKNYGNICAFNSITITKGLAIKDATYSVTSVGKCVDIVKLDDCYRITAQNAGNTRVWIKYKNIELAYFDVSVKDVAVTSANSEKAVFNTVVGSEVNISPVSVEPNYAIYDIMYTCADKNVTISNLGKFNATLEGLYTVQITVGNYNYSVSVFVESEESNNCIFELYDENGDLVTSINLAKQSVINYTILISGDNAQVDVSKLNLVAIIDGKISNDVVSIDRVDTDAIVLTFKKAGNYELILAFDGTIFRTNPIELKIN